MRFRLFASTFLLIFLAELGDKTQLSALAFSATSEKWSVFIAATLALALSTLLAILFGNALTRFISPKFIHIISGLLFIGFAGWIFYEAFQPADGGMETPQTKGVLGIFGLVFLAELGDKTQLTAMARSAGGHKWTVFFAATGALALSTLLAVLFGDLLQDWINPTYIRLASGALFVGFGAWILYRAVMPTRVELSREPISCDGLLVKAALEIAAQFEQAAVEDYNKLLEQCKDPELKELLAAIQQEEAQHLDHVADGDFLEHAETTIDGDEELPSPHELTHDVAEQQKPLVTHAIEHEEASARFYRALANTIAIPSLKRLFGALAEEEEQHADRLARFVEKSAEEGNLQTQYMHEPKDEAEPSD